MGDHLGPWNLALVTVASYDSNLADAASRGLVRLAAPAADAAATAFGAFGAFGAGAHPREFGAVAPRLADALLLGLTFLDALDVDQRPSFIEKRPTVMSGRGRERAHPGPDVSRARSISRRGMAAA